jgi:hypothetical protein
MAKDNLFQELSQQIGQLIASPGAREDMQKSANVLVQNALAKLDLVTREQFDAQLDKLERAETKLQELEQELVRLQAQIDALEAGTD